MKIEQIIREAFDSWKIKHPDQQVTMENAIAKALRDAGMLREDESRLNIAHPFKGQTMTPCTQCGLGYLHDIHKERADASLLKEPICTNHTGEEDLDFCDLHESGEGPLCQNECYFKENKRGGIDE